VALLLVVLGAGAPAALADGDPGSDELLAQNLFTGNLNVSVKQQIGLGDLLNATTRAGAPIRVAIISAEDDLGTVTPLWLKPQTYAEYLGYELSDTYTGRLLVIMPNGYGLLDWDASKDAVPTEASTLAGLAPPSAGTPAAFYRAAVTAIDRVEAGAGVEKSVLAREETGNGSSSTQGVGADSSSSGATSADTAAKATTAATHHKLPTGVLLAVIVALLLLYIALRTGRLRKLNPRGLISLRGVRVTPIALLPTALLAVVVAALAINQIHSSASTSQTSQKVALATNPHIDPGTVLTPARPAPDFTLYNQAGKPVSLRQYRGKVVLLAFIDSECQTICPLTTTAMLDAQAALGKDAHDVQLLGVNANWRSTQIDDVLNYTDLHGMAGRWNFLTDPDVSVLDRVWKQYGVDEEAFDSRSNLIEHVAALYLIDPEGRLRESYTTYASYASVPQLGQLLAQDAAKLLPDHPKVLTKYSYAEAPQTAPTTTTTIPKLGGGTVPLGPGKPHLYLFFATWDSQTTEIAADLDELNTYSRAAPARGLPPITAIDEGSVEPSPGALPTFIDGLAQPLRYPVGIDQTGSVADGYQVQGEPWFVLTNAAGKIVWDQEVYTQGWPTLTRLEQDVRDSLSGANTKTPSVRQAQNALAGSPAPLAALHAQASELLPGGQSALDARIASLRRAGYSVVLNIWASDCAPCQAEFGLFAKASEQYGKKIAFLGADNDDSASDAQNFLNQHHVSYPSYQTTTTSIDSILVGGLQGTPTTVYISPTGHEVSYVHLDNYTSIGALDADIQDYALDAEK